MPKRILIAVLGSLCASPPIRVLLLHLCVGEQALVELRFQLGGLQPRPYEDKLLPPRTSRRLVFLGSVPFSTVHKACE
jgi:hypothetical protein